MNSFSNKTIEALILAVEWIENAPFESDSWSAATKDITLQACKEALEQPAQEPWGWYDNHDIYDEKQSDESIALYTHPAQLNGMDKPLFARVVPWQGLSLSEINDGRDKIENDEDIILDDAFVYGAQWAEQVLRIKNGL